MAEYHVRIKELPASEQPRERLRDYGPSALSDAELVAILLRVGVQGLNVVQLAQKMLMENGGWVGLQRLTFRRCRQEFPHELLSAGGKGEAAKGE